MDFWNAMTDSCAPAALIMVLAALAVVIEDWLKGGR